MNVGIRKKSELFMTRLVLVLYLLLTALPLPAIAAAQEAPAENPASSETPVETVPPPPSPDVPEQPVATPPSTPGPQQPSGPESTSYTYNPGTGLWENQYYTWNPATKKTSPKNPPAYSYNPASNRWDTEQFVYSPEQGKYVPQTVSVPTAGLPINETVEDLLAKIPESPQAKLSPVTTALPASLSSPLQTSVAAPLSNSKLSVSNYNDSSGSYYELFFNASISNQVDSTATSGDASVLQNTTGGSAVTGSASVLANIISMLQSTWGSNGLAPDLYIADIQGDYVGDMVIDPTLLNNYANNACKCGNLEVKSDTNASINNDINLAAISGDATVSGNTNAGSATSGDANVLANVINMINSSIYSGNSFIGLLNINGNFEGDVLLAGSVADQLIAANVPTEEVNLCNCGDLSAILNDNQTINNLVSTSAESGNASVSHNTNAGNAASGDAATNVTVFNITGRNIAGQNAILVFVNVMGEWVGFITDAPAGATAAAFGSGLTENTASGSQAYNADSDMTINNNINAHARSGDAEVSHNTNAGNAATGDAHAAVNLANITSSNFNLNGWFGLLFINVLGNWHGSYGTDTAYGNNSTVSDVPPVVMNNQVSEQPEPGRVSSTTAAGSIGTLPPVVNHNNLRAFAVSFAESDDDKPVVAAATEILPPSNTAPDSSGSTTTPTINAEPRSIANAVLIVSIAAAYLLVFHGSRLKTILPAARRY